MRRFAIICVLMLGILALPGVALADPVSPQSESAVGDPTEIGVPPLTGGGNLFGPFNIPVGVPVPSQSATVCYPNTNVCYGAAIGSGSVGVVASKSDSATYYYRLGGASVVVDPEEISVTYNPSPAPGAGVNPGSIPKVTPRTPPRVCPVVGSKPSC